MNVEFSDEPGDRFLSAVLALEHGAWPMSPELVYLARAAC